MLSVFFSEDWVEVWIEAICLLSCDYFDFSFHGSLGKDFTKVSTFHEWHMFTLYFYFITPSVIRTVQFSLGGRGNLAPWENGTGWLTSERQPANILFITAAASCSLCMHSINSMQCMQMHPMAKRIARHTAQRSLLCMRYVAGRSRNWNEKPQTEHNNVRQWCFILRYEGSSSAWSGDWTIEAEATSQLILIKLNLRYDLILSDDDYFDNIEIDFLPSFILAILHAWHYNRLKPTLLTHWRKMSTKRGLYDISYHNSWYRSRKIKEDSSTEREKSPLQFEPIFITVQCTSRQEFLLYPPLKLP